MSSRHEEKQRRREERLAREQAERSGAARNRRLRFIAGGAVSGLVLAGAVALVVQTLGDATSADSGPVAGLPPRQISDLDDAVKAAGCTLENTPNEGAGHQEKDFKASDYKSNPPTSGTHSPTWYEDGVYGAGHTPELGKLVHTLEHGRINIQYKQGAPESTTRRLEALLSELDDGYHMLLHENDTGMSYAVAATAWDQRLGCPAMNDKVFDAIRTFRDEHIDKGPEVVP
jgi:hypothetical protein